MLKVSASLLNSWAYIWQTDEDYQEKTLNEFIAQIKGQKLETTPAMQRGIDFENLAVAGHVPEISPIIAGGQYQVFGEKVLNVDGLDVAVRGYLDCLKAGVIYDIKRTTKYEYPKYAESYQHHVYFMLVPESNRFTYLIGSGYGEEPYSDKVEFHYETYYNSGKSQQIIEKAIRQFWAWLKNRNLWEDYVANYTIIEKGDN